MAAFFQTLLEKDARWSERLRIAKSHGPLRTAAAILAHSGDSWFWLLGLGITWWLGEDVWKPWALRLTLAILVTATLVMALKFSIRRRRPEGDWGSIYRNADPHSFPSGHAARATLLAILVLAWGPAWLAPVLVLWIPLVSLARVAMAVHYLSDVAAGMFIGALVAIIGLTFFA